jgi:hypothetical protein
LTAIRSTLPVTVAVVAQAGVEKLERAEQHLGDFEGELARFVETQPISFIREAKTDARGYVLFARVEREPPPALSAMAGDCIQKLASLP